MQLVVKDALGNQCTFLPWLSDHCIIHRGRPWSGCLLWGRVGAPASWASGYFWLLWWQVGQEETAGGHNEHRDSQLMDCTVWQADRENWWFPTLGLSVRFRQTEKKKKKRKKRKTGFGLKKLSASHTHCGPFSNWNSPPASWFPGPLCTSSSISVN